MKNILKLLALALVVLMTIGVLVACNGDKGGDEKPSGGENPGGENPGGGEEDVTGTQFTVVFKFVDPNGNPLIDENGEVANITRPVTAPNGALAPRGVIGDPQKFQDWVVTGWDSDGDGVADTGYEKATKSMDVVTICRPKADCVVTFTRLDGSAIEGGEITVKEGTELTDQLIAQYFDIPVEMGKYFKNWVLSDASAESGSSTSCIVDDCTFVPTYGDTQGVVPLVSKGSVTVDGKKDSVYNNAAYLPLNNQRQAEENSAEALDDDPSVTGLATSARFKTKTSAGAYMVWDGEFLYVLIEVSDKTLSGRNMFYVKAVVNAYFNDAVELFYTFEQTQSSTNNRTKVGMDAAGLKLYTIDPKTTAAQKGGRSTHFTEIVGATTCALKPADVEAGGLSVTGYAADGVTEMPSYRIELKIPAKTEGEPDVENYEDIDPETGFIGGTADDYANEAEYNEALMNPDNYKFTEGVQLKAGAFFRISLQVNDLMVNQDVLADPTSGCHEDSSKTGSKAYLYDAEGNEVYPKFSAVSQSQYNTKYYVCFSLGATDESLTTVYSFSADRKFLDKNGNDITPKDE